LVAALYVLAGCASTSQPTSTSHPVDEQQQAVGDAVTTLKAYLRRRNVLTPTRAEAVAAVERLVSAFREHARDGFTDHMQWRRVLADTANQLERRHRLRDQVRRIDRVLRMTSIPDPTSDDVQDPADQYDYDSGPGGF